MIGIKLDMVNGGNPTLVQQGTALLRSQKAVYWRDPSDLSTLFQDSAGTTPVTAVEQPVGLMLDKKTAGQVGAELVTNGTFDSNLSGWSTAGSPTTSWTAGGASVTRNASGDVLHQAVSCVVGRVYLVSAQITSGTIGRIGFNSAIVGGSGEVTLAAGVGTYTARITATATTMYVLLGCAANAATTVFDNISVREIPGAHFVQATPASRPTLSSRYNLLTKTEQFDDVVWANVIAGTGVNPVRVANDAIAPDGTLTADKITFNAPVSGDQSMLTETVTGLLVSASYTVSVSVKAATGGDVGKTILYRTVAGAGYSQLVLTADYQRITLTANAAASSTDGLAIGLRPALGGSTGSVSVHVWGASLVTAADASLPYQRVNTSTDYDYDFSKFLPFLRYDGVDDSQASAATVDLTGTDKITVVGAWHKASDAATGMAVETSTNAIVSAGAFFLAAPWTSGGYRAASVGSLPTVAETTSYPAPTSSVVAITANIAADQLTLRVNGVQAATSSFDQGTGNYGNHTLFVGSRAGSSLRFNGREYGHALFNTTLTASELAAVEAYFRAKSRAY